MELPALRGQFSGQVLAMTEESAMQIGLIKLSNNNPAAMVFEEPA